jgi:hypothetical protein
MPAASSNPPIATVLTPEEEVTLRRVAFGQSEVRAMRAPDLAQLRKLRLIEDSKDGPRLTAAGRRIFDTLPKAAAQRDSRSFGDLMAQMGRLPSEPQR